MIPLTYIIINFIHAYWHSYLIKKNRLIQSGQKVIEYAGLSALTGAVLIFGFDCPAVPVILFALLTRLAFFDIFLNLLRGKNWLYEGQIKKKKSFMDWIENQTGIPIIIFRLLYLVIFVVYLIIYFV